MTKPKPAKRRPRSAAPKAKGGRPPSYRDLFARQAERLTAQGATDADLAAFFEVNRTTIWRWREAHPEFCNALTRGKDLADSVVERSLFERATGYSHEAVKIFQHEGKPVLVPYTERFAPDPTSMIFWLKNRQPQRWRDKPVGDGEDDDLARARRIRMALQEIEGLEQAEQGAGE